MQLIHVCVRWCLYEVVPTFIFGFIDYGGLGATIPDWCGNLYLIAVKYQQISYKSFSFSHAQNLFIAFEWIVLRHDEWSNGFFH